MGLKSVTKDCDGLFFNDLNSEKNGKKRLKSNRPLKFAFKTLEQQKAFFSQLEQIQEPRKKPAFSTSKSSTRVKKQNTTPKDFRSITERNDLQYIRTELAKKLNDIERVDQIVYDYATILEPKISSEENKTQFEQWMIGISYFLGSPSYNHQLFFNHLSKNEFFSNDEEFKVAFDQFTKSIQSHAQPLKKTLATASKVKNIAILYPGSGGGGHKAPAKAMEKDLKARGYNVKLFDTDEFERPYDPKIDGLTRGEIFAKIYQQAGDAGKAFQMWNEGNDKQPLKDRKYMRDLTNELRNFRTNQLFIVAHHQPENATLAYQLGIPATYVHTDGEFHTNLCKLALNQQELDHPLISFTSLSNCEEFFHYLMEHEQKEKYSQLPKKVRDQIVPMQFPVRENFTQVSRNEKIKIRKKLNIEPKATVVKIAMGANGISADIKKIMKKVKEEAHLSKKPLHVLVVCGNNKDLKEELDKMDESTNDVKFQILGFLDEKKMSDFDKSSDVWITKPGGSTSAEALAMRKQMLYVKNEHHPWELTNAQALEKENLAEAMNENESIMAQINRRAGVGEQVEYLQTNHEKWSNQLAKIVNKNASKKHLFTA